MKVSIPPIVVKRLNSAVPKFKKILNEAKERDVNEADTVTIIADMLVEVFGYDKYSEITREREIQGNYRCDLTIKHGEKIAYLLEAKAIGITLSDKHLKQAVGYAAREGINDVVLTNGLQWQIHRIKRENKLHSQELVSFDFLNLNHKRKDEQEQLFLLCKRGVKRDLISEFYQYRQAFNAYTIGALLLTEPVIKSIRAELRKLKAGIKVTPEQIEDLIREKVLKRDILDSDAGLEAKKEVNKFSRKQRKATTVKNKATTASNEALELTNSDVHESKISTDD